MIIECNNCKNKTAKEVIICPSCGFNFSFFQYSSFLSRIGSAIIDNIIISIVYSILLYFLEIYSVLLLLFLYFPLMESSYGTFGKMIFRIKVVSEKRKRISFLRALLRNFLKILFIGIIAIPFTEKKQALHDIISKTIVIKI